MSSSIFYLEFYST